MDLETLEEIRQLKYRYLRCVDEKLWDELADVLTPDATIDYGTRVYGKPLTFTGRDDLIDFFRANLGPGIVTVHAAGQPEITVDGDSAAGTWRFSDTVIAAELPRRHRRVGVLPGPVRPLRGRAVADLPYRVHAHLRGDDVAG